MKKALIILLLLPFAYSEVNVVGGTTYYSIIRVERPIDANTSWMGVYGYIPSNPIRVDYTYYLTPFILFDGISNATVSNIVFTGSTKAVFYTTDITNWYVLMSPIDVNTYNLSDVCGTDPNLLIDGNFSTYTYPSVTFVEESNIVVNGSEYCAYVYRGGEYSDVYLLEYNGYPVFLSPLGAFTINGDTYNFSLLISSFFDEYRFYIVRKQLYCGDLVCDPGEENCTDCSNVVIYISPLLREINGDTPYTSYEINVVNNGLRDLTLTLTLLGDVDRISSYNFGKTELSVRSGDYNTTTLYIVPSESGTHRFYVEANTGTQTFRSEEFTLVVLSPVEENTEGGIAGGAAGGVETNVTEVNEEENIILPYGYYIPSLGCTSYVLVFAPDSIRVSIDENRTLDVVVRNGGTCEENVTVRVDNNMFAPEEVNLYLSPKEFNTITYTVSPSLPGIYYVTISAEGLSRGSKTVKVIVEGVEGTQVRKECNRNIVAVIPESVELSVNERKEIFTIKNLGECLEVIRYRLMQGESVVESGEVRIDSGQVFTYKNPPLDAGVYLLKISTPVGDKEVKVYVGSVAERTVVEVSQSWLLILFLIAIMVVGGFTVLRSRVMT